VPTVPLVVSVVAPCLLLLFFNRVHALAALYAIGVVGAITINLGACSTNRRLRLSRTSRLIMGATALVTLAIWITIGFEKHEALVFAIVILAMGLLARSFIHERRQTRAEAEMRDLLAGGFESPAIEAGVPRILVSVRGVTDTLRFAAEEARAHKGRLGVLFVREVNVLIPVDIAAENDPDARRIFEAVRSVANGVPIEFLYRASDNAPQTILQVLREWKADFYIMGASAEGAIGRLLRGSIVQTISEHLPRRTKLLIYSWRPKSSTKPVTVEA
jgi:nucleotide-binding universal stress UspA family protein